MHVSEQSGEKQLFNILSSIKLASLLFSTILFLNQFQAKYRLVPFSDFYMLSIIIFLLLSIFLLWYVFSVKVYSSKYHRKIQLVENLVYITLFTALILISNTYESQYKLLYIFIIIISTLQLGMKYGITLAVVSSLLILGMDLYFAPIAAVNSYFEKDLILIGVFISTAAALGHYVKLENQKIHQKNLHLKELSNEIKEKEKQHSYIKEMLFNNEMCYNLIFQNSGNAILVHRSDKIIFANESAVSLFAYRDTEELLSRSLSELLSSADIKLTHEKLSELHNTNVNTICFESTVMKYNGDLIVVQNTSTKFIYEGKPTTLSILHDITSDKQVEQLQRDVKKNLELLNETRELNRLTTEFFSNISHELKTPLNVIYSAIQVLNLRRNISEVDYSEKHEKYLSIIKQNCFRLTRLVNNLLDLTKFDSGFLKLNPENHNIVSLVEDISQSVVPYLESKNINFVFDTDTEEEIIAIDPDKIERIILNLLSNAFKFTSPGGEICVNISRLNDSISITVKDTGIGIPEDKLEIIFERFGQVDRTLSRFQEGSGIGLSLVKSFVVMHQGTIDIKSQIGHGSEFIITLPIKKLSITHNKDFSKYENNIERINIEFSDIYSNVV